jgi:hypothetical protein
VNTLQGNEVRIVLGTVQYPTLRNQLITLESFCVRARQYKRTREVRTIKRRKSSYSLPRLKLLKLQQLTHPAISVWLCALTLVQAALIAYSSD